MLDHRKNFIENVQIGKRRMATTKYANGWSIRMITTNDEKK